MSYYLGTFKGKGSSSRMYQYCRETSPQPWNCLNEFLPNKNNPIPPIPPPPIPPIPPNPPNPGIMKTVFLLELTGGFTSNDNSIKDTINYYWNTYPQEFTKCPIVDTQGTTEITLQLLEEYYNYGFRYFVGFSRSTMVIDVLDWFNLHNNAFGISSTSTAPGLNIPKNIFRMTPTDNYLIDSIRTNLENKTVNYIYDANEFATINLIPYIQDISGITLNFYPIASDSDFDALSSLNSGHTGEIMLLYIFINRQYYLNLFSDSNPVLTYTNTQYDISGIGTPDIPVSTALTNNYNTILFKGSSTSIIWRNGYKVLTDQNMSIVTPNILNLLNNKVLNVTNINSHFGILQFDPVSKDIIYPTILIETFTGNNTFTNTSLYLDDPILGKYTATFTNIPPAIETILTPSYTPYGKAIALLELTGNGTKSDTIYNDSLYYYWYNNPLFPKFPVIDTESTILNTLSLLQTYYAQGYRIFLGFTRSSILAATIPWFNAHPDAVGLSINSTSITLNTVPRNIYRLNPSDNVILDAVLPELENKRVFYIYTGGELATEDVLANLLLNEIDVLPYPIGGANLLSGIQQFFTDNNASSSDVTLLYIFDEQPYFDLYNDNLTAPPLTFPGKQYDILNIKIPLIEGSAQTELNNKLYYIQNIYQNTALLWRESADYLTIKNDGTITTSAGIANALNMIDYFLKGKNIGLLASYSSVLQFNSYNDIVFPTFLFRLYKEETNEFVQSSVSFDDPLLGSFQANFI